MNVTFKVKGTSPSNLASTLILLMVKNLECRNLTIGLFM